MRIIQRKTTEIVLVLFILKIFIHNSTGTSYVYIIEFGTLGIKNMTCYCFQLIDRATKNNLPGYAYDSGKLNDSGLRYYRIQ